MARAALFAVLLASPLARADDAVVATLPAPPASTAILPWILPRDALRIDATGELEVSSGKVAKPFAIAPDAWFGATDDLTLGIVESKYAATGFRGSAGGGFCVTSDCKELYNSVGLEGWGALARGPFSLAGGGGPYVTDIAKRFYAVKVGFKARATAGRVSLSAMPSIFIAASHRDDAMAPNTDTLYLPVAFTVKPNSSLAFGLGSGIKGPIEGFSSKWTVPIGFNAAVTLGPVQIGAALTWGALFGGATNPPPPMPAVVGSDLRVVQIWLSYAWQPPPSRRKAEVVVRAAPSPRPAPAPAPAPVAKAAPEPVAALVEAATAQLTNAAAEQVSGETIAQVARDHTTDIHACSSARDVAGQVAIAFEIDGGGKVTRTALASTVADVAVGDCLLRTLRTWRFPEPGVSAASGVYTISFE